MKILQLCTKVPFPMKDGGAAGIFVFSKALVEKGNQVLILAVNPPKHFVDESEYSSLPENIQIVPVFINTNPEFIPALKNLLFTRISYNIYRFYHPDFVNKLLFLLTEFKPDIIQIEGIYMGLYIQLIRKYSSSPIVLREHNVEFQLWNEISSTEKNLIKRVYLKFQAKRMRKNEIKFIHLVDMVTFVTNEDLNCLSKLYPHINGKVIPFGMASNSSLINPIINKKDIYYIGALDWIPNQNALIWFVEIVWPKLLEAFPFLSMHIAGRNAPAFLVNLFHKTKGIKFYGEVEDAAHFAMPFSIMVAPLFSGSGVRVKIIEAMDLGKVVLGSTKAVSGIPAIDGKHLLIADKPNDYVDCLAKLFANENSIAEIGQEAINFVHEFYNINRITTELTRYYNELIG